MTKHAKVEMLERRQLKKSVPNFQVGDTVRVSTKIIEGNKERVQMFTGTVIARKGHGLSETFSLHRVAYGEGMERVFLLNSPRITSIEVIKEGSVRRAKLYYLRGTQGKAAKVKGRLGRKAGRSSTQRILVDDTDEKKEFQEETVNEDRDIEQTLEAKSDVQDKEPEGSGVS